MITSRSPSWSGDAEAPKRRFGAALGIETSMIQLRDCALDIEIAGDAECDDLPVGSDERRRPRAEAEYAAERLPRLGRRPEFLAGRRIVYR